MCFVTAMQLMPLKKKSYDKLTDAQRTRADKDFARFMRSKKGKKKPDMNIDEYLPVLAKKGKKCLMTGIVVSLVYFPIVILVISQVLNFLNQGGAYYAL